MYPGIVTAPRPLDVSMLQPYGYSLERESQRSTARFRLPGCPETNLLSRTLEAHKEKVKRWRKG